MHNGALETVPSGQGLTYSSNVHAYVDKTSTAFTQCCQKETRANQKVCSAADAHSQGFYTPVSTQERADVPYSKVCARINFGVATKKQCLYRTYEEAEEFCVAQGGDLCTLAQLQGDFKGQTASGDMKADGPHGNGVAIDETLAYGAKKLDAKFWRNSNVDYFDSASVDTCGTTNSYVWIKNTNQEGVFQKYLAVANRDTLNPTDVLCNDPVTGGFTAADINKNHNHKPMQKNGVFDAALTASRTKVGFFRPAVKRRGYMRKNYDGKKIMKEFSCVYKGSPTIGKSKKLTMCCFNAE